MKISYSTFFILPLFAAYASTDTIPCISTSASSSVHALSSAHHGIGAGHCQHKINKVESSAVKKIADVLAHSYTKIESIFKSPDCAPGLHKDKYYLDPLTSHVHYPNSKHHTDHHLDPIHQISHQGHQINHPTHHMNHHGNLKKEVDLTCVPKHSSLDSHQHVKHLKCKEYSDPWGMDKPFMHLLSKEERLIWEAGQAGKSLCKTDRKILKYIKKKLKKTHKKQYKHHMNLDYPMHSSEHLSKKQYKKMYKNERKILKHVKKQQKKIRKGFKKMKKHFKKFNKHH
jgi:hypothetical protein